MQFSCLILTESIKYSLCSVDPSAAEFRRRRQPERFGAAASRILVGVPARQPNVDHARRKCDGGAAEGSSAVT